MDAFPPATDSRLHDCIGCSGAGGGAALIASKAMYAAKQTGLTLQQDVVLAPYTTLGVGGPARLFATATSEQDVAAAAAIAHDRGLPLFVLGGGSNLLVSDHGFDGLVLHIAIGGTQAEDDAATGRKRVTAGAGESWESFVQFAVDLDLQGVECLAGIPGSVGGTPVQNVGAYGQEIAETFVSARAYDLQSRRFVMLQAADMGFAYRTSRLNTADRGRYALTDVTFSLLPGGAPRLSYADLKRAFAGPARPSLLEVAEQVRVIRRAKGMVVDASDPDSRSAGSFFRNPVVAEAMLHRIGASTGVTVDAVPHWPAGEGCVKLAAAWLLEQAGFSRGTVLGRAAISSKHTLALTNRGGAAQREIADLRDAIVAAVQEKFGVALEQEPVNVG